METEAKTWLISLYKYLYITSSTQMSNIYSYSVLLLKDIKKNIILPFNIEYPLLLYPCVNKTIFIKHIMTKDWYYCNLLT